MKILMAYVIAGLCFLIYAVIIKKWSNKRVKELRAIIEQQQDTIEILKARD